MADTSLRFLATISAPNRLARSIPVSAPDIDTAWDVAKAAYADTGWTVLRVKPQPAAIR